MNKELEKKCFTQRENLHSLLREHQPNELITVYFFESGDSYNRAIHCALIPNNYVNQALSKTTWDLMCEGGMPSPTRHGDGRVEYYRFGDDTGVEPLVIHREFYGMRKNYLELSEEFRLFHNLYHDTKANNYIKFDDFGGETIIASVEKNRVQIRLMDILQYASIKEMHFSIQFDYREDSTMHLDEFSLKDGDSEEHSQELVTWRLDYGIFTHGKHRAFSRLLGKKLFPPFPKGKSGIWGYSNEPKKQYMEFIIDVDEFGDEVRHSANPAQLDIPGGVPFLKAVHFKKQVLNKYYKEPSKYTVESGHLRCGSLWGLYIDNHHEDRVCVWLGDLGKTLSYPEQQYWASFNIPPKGGISEVYFKRQLMAMPAASNQPEHTFISVYSKLHQLCAGSLGWQLLLPLANDDKYLIKKIRVPSTDEQSDFDSLVQGLTKIIIDSLNERKLNEYIPIKQQANIKGSISRFDTVLGLISAPNHDQTIKFLRNLQELRSSSGAHRKGKNYMKIACQFGVESKNLTTISKEILESSICVINYMIQLIERGYLTKTDTQTH